MSFGTVLKGLLDSAFGAWTAGDAYRLALANAIGTALAPAFAFCTQASGQVVAQASFTTINYDTKVNDADNAVTTGSGWQYLVPAGKGGLYEVSAGAGGNATFSVTDGILTLCVNGAERLRGVRVSRGTSGFIAWTVSGVVLVNAGDSIQVKLYQTQSTSSSLTLESNALTNWITIARLPGSA